MKKLALTVFAAIALQPAWAETEHSSGEEIFKNNCAECHLKTDFRGQSIEMIEERMKSTTGTDSMHESGLTMLSEHDRTAIAAYFAGEEADDDETSSE